VYQRTEGELMDEAMLIKEYPWISANTGGVLVAYVLSLILKL
jgi:hypothetical protein